VERLFDRLERWLGPVLAALLAFITIGVFIQVVLRYVFAMSFLWGEELSLFAFIWCIFLGTAICSVRHSHFSFDMFHGLRGRPAGVQRLIVDLCVLATTIVIPVSGVLMSIVCLMDIVRDCRQIATGESHDPRDAPPPIDYSA